MHSTRVRVCIHTPNSTLVCIVLLARVAFLYAYSSTRRARLIDTVYGQDRDNGRRADDMGP